jgi:ABC-type proline/glycine betaine transport system permease subunit
LVARRRCRCVAVIGGVSMLLSIVIGVALGIVALRQNSVVVPSC